MTKRGTYTTTITSQTQKKKDRYTQWYIPWLEPWGIIESGTVTFLQYQLFFSSLLSLSSCAYSIDVTACTLIQSYNRSGNPPNNRWASHLTALLALARVYILNCVFFFSSEHKQHDRRFAFWFFFLGFRSFF